MAWDLDELSAEIEAEFSCHGEWFELDGGAAVRVVDHGLHPERRAPGRPSTVVLGRPVQQWAADLGVDPRVIFKRLSRGWSSRDAVTTPHLRTRIHRLQPANDVAFNARGQAMFFFVAEMA